MTERKRNGEVKVPIWVAVVTYLACWSLGAIVILRADSWELVLAGFVVVTFPMAGFKPIDLLRDIFTR